MAKVLCECGITRESGYLYFVDKKGNAARVPMARQGQRVSKKQEVMHNCGITRRSGFLYFVDKKGNVAEAAMSRGGKKKAKKSTAKKKRR